MKKPAKGISKGTRKSSLVSNPFVAPDFDSVISLFSSTHLKKNLCFIT